jgi:hypothetical protein
MRACPVYEKGTATKRASVSTIDAHGTAVRDSSIESTWPVALALVHRGRLCGWPFTGLGLATDAAAGRFWFPEKEVNGYQWIAAPSADKRA